MSVIELVWIPRRATLGWLLAFVAVAKIVDADDHVRPCRILVRDQENGWPVPLIELRTIHNVRFVTDNAGVVAFDLPELMDRETWFEVLGHGYEVSRDGFGQRGVRVTPRPDATVEIQVQRTIRAKRLGRLTGAGLFAESQKLGTELDWPESDILGCDSVQVARHRGKLFWTWGDTLLAPYPLGIFDTSSATTGLQPLPSLEPPLRISYSHFRDADGKPRGVAKMAGDGPTWLSAYVSLPDANGDARLVATYTKIHPPLDPYECGLCVWDDAAERFEHLRTVWTKSDETPTRPVVPDGHAVTWTDQQHRSWLLFGNPLPTLRCPASFEGWSDAHSWEPCTPQATLPSAVDGTQVTPQSGSLAWNEYRQCWVTVFVEMFGRPSALGEVWYAEAHEPMGPWGPALKILSHDNYSFYNPRIHPELTPPGSPILLFEGTYTQQFADRPQPTPRYDYNQILYRLDLNELPRR